MMTVKQGRIHGRELRLTGEGPGDRPSYPGGRIIEPDPAAVANFKRIMAQQAVTAPARRQETGIKRAGNGRVDTDLQRKVDELRARAVRPGAQKESSMARPLKMTDEEIIAAHQRYVLEFSSLAATAETTPLGETPLRKQMVRLNLPVRDRGGRFSMAEIERVCQVHGLTPAEIPQSAWPEGETAPAVKSVRARTSEPAMAVVPMAETAVATNGNGQAADDLRTQLGVIQELLSLAEAQRVTLSGKISVELRAEVEF